MDAEIINLLKKGEVGVLPTDTIYGLVGSALKKSAVEKIYQLKKRTPEKPFIILISSLEDLNLFNIQISDNIKKFLEKIWPNPVSVILPCPEEKFSYLHRGTNSLAFRIPKDSNLQKILKQTGPLIAPSANLEGEKPAENIEEAKKYFNDKVSFYLDKGELKSKPSTLITFKDDKIIILRQGVFKINLNSYHILTH